jgi:hypothetical protein
LQQQQQLHQKTGSKLQQLQLALPLIACAAWVLAVQQLQTFCCLPLLWQISPLQPQQHRALRQKEMLWPLTPTEESDEKNQMLLKQPNCTATKC